jgi:hypothetical protein
LADLSAIQKDEEDADSNARPLGDLLAKLDEKVDVDPPFGLANHSRMPSNAASELKS